MGNRQIDLFALTEYTNVTDRWTDTTRVDGLCYVQHCMAAIGPHLVQNVIVVIVALGRVQHVCV